MRVSNFYDVFIVAGVGDVSALAGNEIRHSLVVSGLRKSQEKELMFAINYGFLSKLL